MRINNLFNFKKKCLHPNVPIDVEVGYCTDCGELIENKWYITRCGCCGLKLQTTIRNDEVVPQAGICHNCGSKTYTVEQIDKIDCININYAIVVREIVKNEITEYTQSWIEAMQTSNCTQKLLQQFR